MPDQTIKCPKCGADIELSQALAGPIEQAIRVKYEADAKKKEQEIAQKLNELQEKEKTLKSQQQTIDDEIEKRLGAERKKIAEQAKELDVKRQAIDEQVAGQLKAERKNIAKQERAKILAEQSEQTRILEEELEEKRKLLVEANKKELEFLKKQRELEEKSEALELEVERKLSSERKKIVEEASKRAAEEQQLKMREKEDLIKSMQDQIEALKRKAETGSQERQGEALEGELQEMLERSFPIDKFEEIKKGVRGADILQKVHNSAGKECGTILWESKNTKDFQKSWIEKLKKDRQRDNANIAVILSIALPKEIESFGPYDDVWVTDYRSATGLATALRQGLIEVARQKLISAGQDSMKDIIYQYITGHEFVMHIKAVVGAYQQMQEDLESEKRAMNRIWKKREKQIVTVLDNVTGIYGSIEGIVGKQKALPGLDTLSLESIAPEDDTDLDE